MTTSAKLMLLTGAFVLAASPLTAGAALFADGFESGAPCAWSTVVGPILFSSTDHLLVTKFATAPTEGEFVEIANPTASAIALDNYYLYGATAAQDDCFYYHVVTGTECGGPPFPTQPPPYRLHDFSLRFPDLAAISPGQRQVIAITGSINYCNHYFPGGTCVKPTYEIPPPEEDDVEVADMRGVWDTADSNFSTTGFLDDVSEDLVLFRWDGASSTVADVDYLVWGTDMSVRTNKTGIPGYVADTPVASQLALPRDTRSGLS